MFDSVSQGKNTAIVSYLTLIGTIVAIFMNQEHRNPFASFHIRQALGISLTWIAFNFIASYLDNWNVSIAFAIMFFVLWIYGFLGALAGEERMVPVLGKPFQKIFKSL